MVNAQVPESWQGRFKGNNKLYIDESLVANIREVVVSEGWKSPQQRISYLDLDTGRYKNRISSLNL